MDVTSENLKLYRFKISIRILQGSFSVFTRRANQVIPLRRWFALLINPSPYHFPLSKMAKPVATGRDDLPGKRLGWAGRRRARRDFSINLYVLLRNPKIQKNVTLTVIASGCRIVFPQGRHWVKNNGKQLADGDGVFFFFQRYRWFDI